MVRSNRIQTHRSLTWHNVDKRRSSPSFESRSPGAAEGSLSPFESWRIHSMKMGRTAALIPSTWTRPKILRIEHDNLPSLAVYALAFDVPGMELGIESRLSIEMETAVTLGRSSAPMELSRCNLTSFVSLQGSPTTSNIRRYASCFEYEKLNGGYRQTDWLGLQEVSIIRLGLI